MLVKGMLDSELDANLIFLKVRTSALGNQVKGEAFLNPAHDDQILSLLKAMLSGWL